MNLKPYTVKRGRHWSWPFTFSCSINPKESVWEVYLDGTSSYILKSLDQKDWNKLLGIKKRFFDPHHFTFMLGHRWNVEEQQHEFSPYLHLPWEDKPVFHFTGKWFSLPVECHFLIMIKVEADKVVFSVDVKSHDVIVFDWKHELQKPVKGLWWDIATWFGGNRTAPSNYTIWKAKR